ncbi:MAG TPA: flagellar biosynthesis anti-sigma factor FlgM [Candidatus Wallbacteria bacterium]|nr:flagellar biosynthesis anti-sigma factor FlgM [Candidatus Wallbacteria bacterium]
MKITNTNIPMINDQPKVNRKDGKKVESGKGFDEVMKNRLSEETKKTESSSKSNIANVTNAPVNVTKQATQMKEIANFIKNSDDIRTDKVEDIKAKIANGTYNVSSEDLADKLMSSGLVDSLLKSL